MRDSYTEVDRARDSRTARDLVAGLTSTERGKYSFRNVVRGLLGDRAAAGLEWEVSDELQRQLGVQPKTQTSVIVPVELVCHGSRDANVSQGSAGGFLVDTDVGPEIPALRARSVLARLGAQVLPNLQGNLVLPKFNTGATANWLPTEVSTILESTPLLSVAALAPKSLGSFCEVSRSLLQQSSAERVIRNDLVAGLGAAVDSAGLNGSGAAGEPFGLLQADINAVTGTSIAWSGILDFILNAANANTELTGFAMAPAVYKLLANREKFTGAGAILINQEIDGRSAIQSTNVPAATLIGGSWPEIFIGLWGTLDLALDRFTKFKSAMVGMRAIWTVDIAVRYPAAFSKATSIT